MNFDEYLLDQQNSIDNMSSDVEKTWLIVADEEEVYFSSNDFDAALKVFETVSKQSPSRTFEIGWLWESEVSSDFDYMYKLFNPIKP